MESMSKDNIINFTNLISLRNSLKVNVEKTKTLGLAIQECEIRLEQINIRLPGLESAVRPIRAQPDALDAVAGHINKAVVPAAAVLKVLDAIHGLEKSLCDPKSDVSGYLTVLGNLRGAVKFLSDNYGMAVEWLGDIVEYLEDYNVADIRYVSSLKEGIMCVTELQHEEKGCLYGGLLAAALDRLEGEFRRPLTENSVPLAMPSSRLKDEQACISPSPLPVPVIKKLQDIVGSLIANDRLERCKFIYVDVRSSIVRASLQALNLDYLDISVSEFNDANSIEGYIAKWSQHLEFVVKHLFEAEYKLWSELLFASLCTL